MCVCLRVCVCVCVCVLTRAFAARSEVKRERLSAWHTLYILIDLLEPLNYEQLFHCAVGRISIPRLCQPFLRFGISSNSEEVLRLHGVHISFRYETTWALK